MPETVRYRCRNCGERFEKEVLTEDEKRAAIREGRPLSNIRCPNPDCDREDVRRGWD